MSYILDALKRADTERTRGAVPGLHARQLPDSVSAAATGPKNLVGWLAAAAVLLGAMAVGLWLWRLPSDEPRASAPGPLVAAPASLPLPVAAPAMPMPTAPTATTLPALAPAPRAPANLKPTPKPTQLPSAAVATTSVKPDAAPSPAAQASAAQAPPAAVPLLSELPESLRRQIPALTITGTVYSDDPKQRLLLVNNQVLPQGRLVAADVTLEEIRPHSSVFRFQGTRFKVTH